MMRKLCAVGMRNAILRNYIKLNLLAFNCVVHGVTCIANGFLHQNDMSSCDLREQDTSKHLWTLSEASVMELVRQLSLPNPPTEIFQ